MNKQFSLQRGQSRGHKMPGRPQAMITIMQFRSSARSSAKKVATLKGLRLGKINRISILEDTPAIRGMVDCVAEMVVVLAFDDRQVFPIPSNGRTLPHEKYRVKVGNDSSNRNLSALEETNWNRERFDAAGQEKRIRVRPSVRNDKNEQGQKIVASPSGAAQRSVAWKDVGIAEVASDYAKAMERYMISRYKELRAEVVQQSEKLIYCMYHGEPAAARRAAYGLLAASPNYRDPKLPPTLTHELSNEQNLAFKNRLRAFLDDTGKPLIVDVKANIASSSKDDLVINVDVVAKRCLPFDIANEQVFLRRDKFADSALRVTCIGARTAHEKASHSGKTELSTVMEFMIDRQIVEKGLNIVVQSGSYVEPIELSLDAKTTSFSTRTQSAAS